MPSRFEIGNSMHSTYVRRGSSIGHPESGVWYYTRGPRADHLQLNITIDCDDTLFPTKTPSATPTRSPTPTPTKPPTTYPSMSPTLKPQEACMSMNVSGTPAALAGIYDQDNFRGFVTLRDGKSRWTRRKCSGQNDKSTKPGCKANRKTAEAADVDGTLYWSNSVNAWVLSGWDYLLTAPMFRGDTERPPRRSVWKIMELARVLEHVADDPQWTVSIDCFNVAPSPDPPAKMIIEEPPEDNSMVYTLAGVLGGLVLLGVLYTFAPPLDVCGKKKIEDHEERLRLLEDSLARTGGGKKGTEGRTKQTGRAGDVEMATQGAGADKDDDGEGPRRTPSMIKRHSTVVDMPGNFSFSSPKKKKQKKKKGRTSKLKDTGTMAVDMDDAGYAGGFSPNLPDIPSTVLD